MNFTPLMVFNESTIEGKEQVIENHIRGKKVLVAFSGGVDSALVAYFASKYADETVLVMQVGLSVGIGEETVARQLALDLKLPLKLVEYNEFELDQNYTQNPENRCYYCKNLLHGFLEEIRADLNYDYVLNGTNATDMTGHRPGHQAAENFGSLSPLLDAGLTKSEIRFLARKYHLSVWDKPATACLASRFKTGVPITEEQLKIIANAEHLLKETYDLKQIRLRYDGTEYILEIDLHEINYLSEQSKLSIINFLKSMGVCPIKTDIKPYQSREL